MADGRGQTIVEDRTIASDDDGSDVDNDDDIPCASQ